MENTVHIINWQNGTYIGKFANTDLAGYIKALEDIKLRYAKPHKVNAWIQTCNIEGHEKGHYETVEVMALDDYTLVSYVNRSFANPDVVTLSQQSHRFSHAPHGGKFHLSSYIEFLKLKV